MHPDCSTGANCRKPSRTHPKPRAQWQRGNAGRGYAPFHLRCDSGLAAVSGRCWTRPISASCCGDGAVGLGGGAVGLAATLALALRLTPEEAAWFMALRLGRGLRLTRGLEAMAPPEVALRCTPRPAGSFIADRPSRGLWLTIGRAPCMLDDRPEVPRDCLGPSGVRAPPMGLSRKDRLEKDALRRESAGPPKASPAEPVPKSTKSPR